MKMRRREFLGLLGPAGFLGSRLQARPQTSTRVTVTGPEDLGELLRPVLTDSGLPALAAGVVRGGRMAALGAVGVRKEGDETPATRADKFHIGSCTKAMTATLAAMLVSEGRLDWTSTLAEVFPERRDQMDPAFRATTLGMLLTHRSGLAANGSSYGSAKAPVTEQRLAYLDAILSKPPAHEPDTYNYSNAGYIVAGAMLERVTGKSWEDLMMGRLFKPLGMASAGFGVAAKPRQVDQPWGHVRRGGKFVPTYGDNHRALGPAGTVHCAVEDYLRFAALHASMGARPEGLVSRATCGLLHKPAKGNYAFGWGVCERSWARGHALNHSGSNTMNYFVVWVAPAIDLALAVATNASDERTPAHLDSVAGALVGRFAA